MCKIMNGLSWKARELLQVHVSNANAAEGLNLTLEEWIVLQLQGIAVTAQLAADWPPIQEKLQREGQKRMTARALKERDKLIRSLD